VFDYRAPPAEETYWLFSLLITGESMASDARHWKKWALLATTKRVLSQKKSVDNRHGTGIIAGI
jgi:hypothetical protein